MTLPGDIYSTPPTPAQPQATPRPVRPRRRFKSHRSFFAHVASEDSVHLPRVPRPGYLAQARLVRAAHDGDIAAKQALWLAHARLSYSVVNRYRVNPQDVADCLQAAQIGLSRAIDRFDLLRLNEFSTYAYHWLRQAVQRHRHQRGYFIRIPAHLFAAYMSYRWNVVESATPAEWFEARSGMIESAGGRYLVLVRIHAAADPARLREKHTAANIPQPLDNVITAERASLLHQALDTLPHRQRYVLVWRYGLGGVPECTLEELGAKLNLTRERVRQIQVRAERGLLRVLIQLGFEKPAEPDEPDPEAEPVDDDVNEVAAVTEVKTPDEKPLVTSP
jgi:RNA polymerase primary sigma factor